MAENKLTHQDLAYAYWRTRPCVFASQDQDLYLKRLKRWAGLGIKSVQMVMDQVKDVQHLKSIAADHVEHVACDTPLDCMSSLCIFPNLRTFEWNGVDPLPEDVKEVAKAFANEKAAPRLQSFHLRTGNKSADVYLPLLEVLAKRAHITSLRLESDAWQHSKFDVPTCPYVTSLYNVVVYTATHFFYVR